MTFLSLFSGIGLHDLGLEAAGFECIGQCEIDTYCSAVLADHWPALPRWGDIHDVNRANIIQRCGQLPRCITGGFPCQQISAAGKGEGIGTAEQPTAVSGLFWELLRVIKECKPEWLIIENVPALRTRGADRVITELEGIGYAVWPCVVGAEHVKAPHKRHRVWLMGHAESFGRPERWAEYAQFKGCTRPTVASAPMAHAHHAHHAQRWPRDTTGYHVAGSSGVQQDGPKGSSALRYISNVWPARPGEVQYTFECPRVIPIEVPIKPRLGRPANGSQARVA